VFLSFFKRGWRGNPAEEKPLLGRLGLHAATLSFTAGGAEMLLQAPPARDLNALISQMKKNADCSVAGALVPCLD
jgi:23S rRNA pseudouridine1911/1915/1917 synthase